jgi:hypothetical protein
MDSIATDFPELVSRVKIGETFEKRPMYVLKVRPKALPSILTVHKFLDLSF